MYYYYLIGIVLGQQQQPCTLHQAARNADLSCIGESANWSELNEHGSNALHSALQGDNGNGQMLDVVTLLLEQGVSVELVNANGFLPAHALYRNAKITEEEKLTILAKMKDYGPVPSALPWVSAFGLPAMPPPKMSHKLQAAATFYSLFPEYSTPLSTQDHGTTLTQCDDEKEELTQLAANFEKVKTDAEETQARLGDEINQLKIEIGKLSEPKPEKVCDTTDLDSHIVALETALKDAQNALNDKMTEIEQQAVTIDELKKIDNEPVENCEAIVEVQHEPCECSEQ